MLFLFASLTSQQKGDTFYLTPSGSKDAAQLAGVLYHLSQPCEESPGFVGGSM
jgi:hypothetical protein